MKALRASEVEALLREIQRYLAYVEALRRAGNLGRSAPGRRERKR